MNIEKKKEYTEKMLFIHISYFSIKKSIFKYVFYDLNLFASRNQELLIQLLKINVKIKF